MKDSPFGLMLYLAAVENILLLPSSVKPITTRRRVFFAVYWTVCNSLSLMPILSPLVVLSMLRSGLLGTSYLFVVRWVVIQDHAVIFFDIFTSRENRHIAPRAVPHQYSRILVRIQILSLVQFIKRREYKKVGNIRF